MTAYRQLPLPVLDALPLGAHRLMAFTDEGLFETCGVRVAFTGRDGGVSAGDYASLNCGYDVGDDSDAVRENRRIACEAVGADPACLFDLRQVHGDTVVRVTDDCDMGAARREAHAGADGVVVGRPGIAALIISADCPVIVIVSPSGRFACAHAGWRGAVAGIAGKTLRELANEDDCDPSRFNAYIGPHLCADCFEVGRDVSERFQLEFGEECVPDARHVDLMRAIAADLVRNGMMPERVIDGGMCTKCSADAFFSYRASGGSCGRQCALAVWTPADEGRDSVQLQDWS